MFFRNPLRNHIPKFNFMCQEGSFRAPYLLTPLSFAGYNETLSVAGNKRSSDRGTKTTVRGALKFV